MNRITTLTMAAAMACLLAAGGALLDGPSEADIAAATAADLADARMAAQRFERDYRECLRLMGPGADLIQIEGTSDYVCRKVSIEPTPVEILRKYSDLGVQR